MNNDISNRMITEYTTSASDSNGDFSAAVRSNDRQRQYMRFGELVSGFDLNNDQATLLDIGCGNGELYLYLNFRGWRGAYTGIDITDALLTQARERFSAVKFEHRDIMSETGVGEGELYDYCCISGVFNVNVGQDFDWAAEFVKRSFAMCKAGLAFNAISTYTNWRDDDMFYISPEEMFGFCVKNLSPRVTLAHHNLPYNYTVHVYKNTDWRSI
jgi:SAM-dependent methyltransferase